MSDIAINVNNISKRYRIGLKEKTNDTFVGAIGSIFKSPFENFKRLKNLTHFKNDKENPDEIIWALKNITFEVKMGEVIGIIGANGAGKSTLLKILAQITHPSTGRVQLNGRVASLLEVGTGFHPELTGRENIYLNGTILGMKKYEIDYKLDEIVEFSGIEKFLDTPVKRYSSGMGVRLAFSVAAHLEPEILLIDEVLAVGDANFQKKCLGKMDAVAKNGRTVIFVSHNLAAMENLSEKGIYLKNGKIKYVGTIHNTIIDYRKEINNYEKNKINDKENRSGLWNAKIDYVQVKNSKQNTFSSGNEIIFEVKFDVLKNCFDCYFILAVKDENDIIRFVSNSLVYTNKYFTLSKNCILRFKINYLPLPSGSYIYDVKLNSRNGMEDKIINYGKININPGDFFKSGRIPKSKDGLFVKGKWEMVGEQGFD